MPSRWCSRVSSCSPALGAGSAYSLRLTDRAIARNVRPVSIAVAGIVGIAAIYLLILPWLFGRFIGAADGLRVLLSVVLIAPLAFFMGMPFPLGLRCVAEQAPDFVPYSQPCWRFTLDLRSLSCSQ
jgi:hypothetical protein